MGGQGEVGAIGIESRGKVGVSYRSIYGAV